MPALYVNHTVDIPGHRPMKMHVKAGACTGLVGHRVVASGVYEPTVPVHAAVMDSCKSVPPSPAADRVGKQICRTPLSAAAINQTIRSTPARCLDRSMFGQFCILRMTRVPEPHTPSSVRTGFHARGK